MLHGRRAECAALDRLLADAGSPRGGALVLRGEAGAGKSALLDHTADKASAEAGMHVLRGAGVEAESALPFAALHQLLGPILDLAGRLPQPQAATLRGALGQAEPSAGDRFLIGVATLGLLTAAAERRPLLCLVDDAQWLDGPSAAALSFAARRLRSQRVVLLFAARDDGPGDPDRFDAPGVPELRLGGLDRVAAGALLEELVGTAPPPAARPGAPSAGGPVVAETRRLPLAPEVRERLLDAAGGNPLALIELPSALCAEQLAGVAALPDPLPVGAEVTRAFLRRVVELPAATRALLLVAAADERADAAVVLAAARALGVDAEALAAAETARLVRVADGRVAFRHPLLRSAVYVGATSTERRAAHRALATALGGEEHADRRAWHLAGAAIEPDAEVAAELERSAGRARRRGGHAAAARALERSAELTAAVEARGRRLAAAADAAWLGGQPDRALALLDRATSVGPGPRERAEIGHLRGVIELRRGVPADAFTMLAAAAAEVAPLDPSRALAILATAREAASYAGDAALTVETGRRAALLGPGEDRIDRFRLGLLVGIGGIVDGDVAIGARRLREALALGRTFDDASLLASAGTAARYLGDDAATHDLYARAVALARAGGELAMLPCLLESLALSQLTAGRYPAATATATEGLRLATETGQESSACRNLATLAMAAALQGCERECRADATAALSRAVPRGLRLQAASATWALALLELGMNRPADALARLEGLSPGSETGHPVVALLAVPDLVEAAARADQPRRARNALACFERWAAHATAPWALALVPRCRGLLAAGAAADRHFAEALRLHRRGGRPFDRARTELVWGEALRRARRRAEAREHLRAALTTFEQLGAAPWAERARAELRVSGETARRRDPSTRDQLTPRELQIIQFVGDGATNREVAAQLFLSPRTIDYHLRQIFTKLDISSRAELIRLRLAQAGHAGRGAEPL
jgi:DNA-binding CsgD family transcriptional regulator